MPARKELNKFLKVLKNHEKRICVLEGRKEVKETSGAKTWYKSGSTVEKLVLLIKKGFFNVPRKISDIIFELKSKDYHLEASDLTLPLRKIVRKGLLTRMKKTTDGTILKKWSYVKV